MVSLFRIGSATLGWSALALQYWLVMTEDIGPEPVGRTINFFSYFTIMVNLLAALAWTAPGLAPQSAAGRFFARPSVRTAIAGYIIIVMAVVYLVLRHLSDLHGWAFVADLILHYVMPALFVVDWLFFVPKGTLRPRDIPMWLAAPIA